MAVFDFAGFNDIQQGLAVQQNGSVLVSGRAVFGPLGDLDDFAVVRFNSDGSLDTGFGNGGAVTIDINDLDMASGVLVQNDPICWCEKIIINGSASPITLIARLLAG